MIVYRSGRGAILAWRQGTGVPVPATAAPTRGWSLMVRGYGRAQISRRMPDIVTGGSFNAAWARNSNVIIGGAL